MKLTVIFGFVILIASCTSNKQRTAGKAIFDSNSSPVISNSTSYFDLQKATSEPWVSGIRGGANGIEHSFQISIKSDQKLIFEKVWMKDRVFDVFVSKEHSAITSDPVVYSKNDVIVVRVTEFQSDSVVKIEPPLKYEGEALIGFTANGKQEYFVVKEIKKLPTQYRQ